MYFVDGIAEGIHAKWKYVSSVIRCFFYNPVSRVYDLIKHIHQIYLTVLYRGNILYIAIERENNWNIVTIHFDTFIE